MGLPPSLSLEYIDCEFPTDLDETISSTGEAKHSCKLPMFFDGKLIPTFHSPSSLEQEMVDTGHLARNHGCPCDGI